MYGDPNDISCRCISEVGYVSVSHKLGDDCYDGSDFGSFFNDDVIWRRVYSGNPIGGIELMESCNNLFSEGFTSRDWIYASNSTHYLICERTADGSTDFNNIQSRCSLRLI